MMAVVIATILIANVVRGLSAQAAKPERAPAFNIIPVRVPAAFATADAQLGAFTLQGDLWLVARLREHDASTLVKISPETGRMLETVSADVVVRTAMTVGLDGNTWFAGSRADQSHFDVGYVTGNGKIRLFSTPIPTGYGVRVISVVTGPEGMMWFNAEDGNGIVWLGHVTLRGKVRVVRLRSLVGWLSGLEFTPNGQLYASGTLAKAGDNDTLRLSLAGQYVKRFRPIIPNAADANGDVFGWSYTSPNPSRLTPQGKVSIYPWMTASLDNGLPPNASADPLSPLQGAIVRASDNRIWFAAGESYYPGSDSPSIPFNWVLGQIGANGKVITWPCAFIGADGGPVGDALATNQDALVPGPDGRLYSVAYKAATNGSWRLYTATLPDQPTMGPAKVQIKTAHQLSDHIDVVVSCRGQIGRVCGGEIEAVVNGRVAARQTYAVEPGYRNLYALASAAVETGNARVFVTSHDPETGMTETTSAPAIAAG